MQRPSPVQQQSPAMPPRSPKRRKSNDSEVIEVHHVQRPRPQPQKPSAPQRVARVEVPASSSPLTGLPPSQIPAAPKLNVDYQAVLLSLSDEYVTAAYSLSPSISAGMAPETALNEYHKLISTAMGCLESVLKNYRLADPKKEARIRLRLATLLHDETENSEQAEDVLSKGIALCDRNKLQDQKYAMHHLMIRTMAKSNVKAAMKSVEKLIAEVEALKLVPWFYAFRFLRVFLGLQSGGHADLNALPKHLTVISETAQSLGHVAVHVMAANLEAFVHLLSGTPDATDLAQRALAAARTHQLAPELQKHPQLRSISDCLDVACAAMTFNQAQVDARMPQMLNTLDAASSHGGWEKDGPLLLPVGHRNASDIELDTANILANTGSGEIGLAFKWLTRSQLYPVGSLLSGMACMPKNAEDHLAEKNLQEGLKCLETIPNDRPQSLSAGSADVDLRSEIRTMLRLELVLAYCLRNEWKAAAKALDEVDKSAVGADDQLIGSMLTYLEAVCKQSMGDLNAALTLYRSPHLSFAPDSKASGAVKDLQAAATLNSINILQKLDPPEADLLIPMVENYCLRHTNKSFVSAYWLVKASGVRNANPAPPNPITQTKKYLQTVIQTAQKIGNHQFTCLGMNMLSLCFFQGIVGDQAVKSVRASRTLAKRARNPLWEAVADEMFAHTLTLCGQHAEAVMARREAQERMQKLPEKLWENLQRDLA
jgi:hypothetical protein